jgi:hypothetical protein
MARKGSAQIPVEFRKRDYEYPQGSAFGLDLILDAIERMRRRTRAAPS